MSRALAFTHPGMRAIYVEDLARYNAEVYRGIVHTREWRAAMERAQKEFDRQNRPIEREAKP